MSFHVATAFGEEASIFRTSAGAVCTARVEIFLPIIRVLFFMFQFNIIF